MKKLFIAAILAGAASMLSSVPASAQAYIYVQAGPPAPIYETVPPRPGAGYVWVGGYYRWNGYRYVWVHGHYVRHGGAWCGGHWRHGARGWYWVEGHWC